MTPTSTPPHRPGRRAALGTLAVLLAGPALAQQAPRDEGFQAFWQGFRAAALAGDLGAVARMSRLPVESRGELDDDPVLRLTAATFPPELFTPLFENYLGARAGTATPYAAPALGDLSGLPPTLIVNCEPSAAVR